MSFLEDENIKVKITRISGRKPRYDAWSVDAKAWIEEEKEIKFERDIRLNVLKEDGQFNSEGENGKNPTIVRRVKEKYEKILKEDREFKKFFANSLEDERSKVDEIEGSEFQL